MDSRPETPSPQDRPGRPAPEIEIRFQTPRFWSPVMLAVVAGAVGGLVLGLALLAGRDGVPPPAFIAVVVAAALAFAGFVWAARRASVSKTPPALQVYDEKLVLPRGAASRRYVEVDMADVLSVDVYGSGQRGRLIINTRKRPFVYPLAATGSTLEDIWRLRQRVRAALARRPDGPTLLAEMDRREALGRSALSVQPRATFALLAVIVAVFAWEHASGALDSPFGLLALGANAPALVAEGQWFRLFAANFLHANSVHIFFNGLALYVLGVLLERLIGPGRLLTIFFAGALGGSVLSALLAPALMSVGASTAVFGLLGALAWVNWRFRTLLPAGFFQPVKWWAFIIGLNALLPILVPQIDYAAHAGGFVAGAATAMLLCRSPDSVQPGRPAPRGVQLAAGVLAGLFALGQVQAVQSSLQPPAAAERELMRTLIRDDATPAEMLNNVAWNYVTSPRATAQELELALAAARRAVGENPQNGPYLDTLATAYYRLGRFDDAVETQRRALAVYDEPFVVSQLGRFLSARVREAGPVELGGASASDVEVDVAPPGDSVVVSVEAAFGRGLVIYALATTDDGLAGVFEAVVGGDSRPQQFEWRADGGEPVPPDAGLEIALVDASGCGCAPGSFEARFVPMDPDAAELP